MSDAFISYSRRDSEFVRRLAAALGERGKTVWLDVDDIAPASRWSDELKAAILQAEAFVFVMSPDSAASPECAKELEYAVALNKRIVPVHFEQTDVATLDIELATRNWIPQVGLFTDNFTDSVDTLIRAIETDLDWVHQHTLWLGKALEWEEHSDDASFLLRGSELDAAEQWLAGQAGKTPPATALHQRFVLESRRAVSSPSPPNTRRGVGRPGRCPRVGRRRARAAQHRGCESAHHTLRQLAAQAEVALSTDPEQGTGLAMQALKVKNTAQADAALRDALPRMQVLQTLNVGDRTNDAEFDHGGRTVVTASDNGTATLWDVGTGRRIKDLVPADHAALTTAVFDRAAPRVVTGGKDGITRLWSVPTCTVVKELKEPGGAEVTRADLQRGWFESPDGRPRRQGDCVECSDGEAGIGDRQRRPDRGCRVQSERALRGDRGRRWHRGEGLPGRDGQAAVVGADRGRGTGKQHDRPEREVQQRQHPSGHGRRFGRPHLGIVDGRRDRRQPDEPGFGGVHRRAFQPGRDHRGRE